MSEICRLILDQHHEVRLRFAELDEFSIDTTIKSTELAARWAALRQLLDAHAEAEEMLVYPLLLRIAGDARVDTVDPVSDHKDIRDACRRTEDLEPASDDWWAGVWSARASNSRHMAEEELGALPDLRTAVSGAAREDAAGRWEAFMTGRRRELAAPSNEISDRYVAATEGGGR